ncbi:MAG: hypothetical protein WAV28_19115 [Sedimentisphaerales bacterium]|jgi:hypothetical protein
MIDLIQIITPWIAVISAIVAGFVAYRSQLRLKAFELLLSRRSELLKAIEERIEFYREVIMELDSGKDECPHLDRFCRTEFHEGLILYHRAKGVALGPLADALIETYWAVNMESISGSLDRIALKGHLERKINSLAAFYGFSQSKISHEIEALAISKLKRILRLVGIKEKLKVEKEPKKSRRGEQIPSADSAKGPRPQS